MLKRLLVFNLIVLANCKGAASGHLKDIDSDVTASGRSGAGYLYWIDDMSSLDEASRFSRTSGLALFQGQCPNPDLRNRDSCRQNIRAVTLESFFASAVGSQSKAAISALDGYAKAEGKIAAAIAANTVLAQDAGLGSDQRQVLSQVSDALVQDAASQATAAERIAKNLAPLLNVLKRMSSFDPSIYDEDSLKSLPPAEQEIIRQLPNYVAKAAKKDGKPCSIADASQRFKTTAGGCLDTSTNVVWGNIATSFGGAVEDVWFDRNSAIAACSSQALGGYYDWRIPTKEELQAVAMGHAAPLGMTPNRLYWTSTEGEKKVTEDVEGQLPDRDILSNQTDVLLGYSRSASTSDDSSSINSSRSAAQASASRSSFSLPDQVFPIFRTSSSGSTNASSTGTSSSSSSGSSKAVTGKAFMVLASVGRSVKGKVEVTGAQSYLVQAGTGKEFIVTKYSLSSATGTLNSLEVEKQDKPLAVVESSYSSALSAKSKSTADGSASTAGFNAPTARLAGFESMVDASASSFSSNSSATSSSSTVKEAGRDRTVRIIGEKKEMVNPLNYVAYSLPKDIKPSEIGVICVRGASL